MNLVRFEKVSDTMYDVIDERGYVGYVRLEDGWILCLNSTSWIPENTIREIANFITTH